MVFFKYRVICEQARFEVDRIELYIAIRGILPKNLRQTIIHLCIFFNTICGKVIFPEKKKKLDEFENEIVVILIQKNNYTVPTGGPMDRSAAAGDIPGHASPTHSPRPNFFVTESR